MGVSAGLFEKRFFVILQYLLRCTPKVHARGRGRLGQNKPGTSFQMFQAPDLPRNNLPDSSNALSELAGQVTGSSMSPVSQSLLVHIY